MFISTPVTFLLQQTARKRNPTFRRVEIAESTDNDNAAEDLRVAWSTGGRAGAGSAEL